MPFTVSDFEDLVRLLYEHPEWRERLRSVILPEEILTLPQLVRENTEAIRRLEEAVAQLAEAQRRTEQRVEELAEFQRRAYEEFAEYRKQTDTALKELAEAQRRTEERVEELAEAQRRTDEHLEELAEAQRRTQEEFYAYRASTDMRLDRLERRVDNLASQVGQLVNIIGATLEEEAQDSVATLIRYKGYKAEQDGYPVRIDSVGEIDVVLPVESPSGERLTVVAESKARLSRRAVTDWANRMKSPDFRRKLKEAGVPGPYLMYMYAIRVDPAALDEARKVGIGVMSGRGELVEPAGVLPEA